VPHPPSIAGAFRERVRIEQPVINDGYFEAPMPPELRGEAASGTYKARTGDGVEVSLDRAIFPIVRYDSDGRLHLVGTGFFIATNGLFVTAKHVLMHGVFDSTGRQLYPIGILQFIEGNIYIQRPILRCAYHPMADVAVGVAAPIKDKQGQPLSNPILKLTLVPPVIGSRVVTYAYPRHANVILESGEQRLNLMPRWYDGNLEEHFPNGRDQIFLPKPCFRTSIFIHGGASGGPVFSRAGAVFGVNSTGIEGTDISFVSRLDEIFQLTIDDVILGSRSPASVPVIEMARAGHIIVSPPL